MVKKLFNPREIRREVVPFVVLWCLYYGYAMLSSTYFAVFDIGTVSGAELDFHVSTHVCLFVSVFASAICIKKELLPLVGKVISPVLAVLLMFLAIFDVLLTSVIFACVLGVLFGLLCYQVLYTFCFVLNNTERVYSIVISNAILCALGAVTAEIGRQSLAFRIIMTVFATACAVVQFFCKPVAVADLKNDKLDGKLKLTVIIGLAASVFSTGAVILAANSISLQIGNDTKFIFFIGGVIGCALFVFSNMLAANPVQMTVNATFALTILGLVFAVFLGNSVWVIYPAELCLGAAFILGMLSVYSIVATLAQRYNTHSYLKWIIGMVGLVGGIAAPICAVALLKYFNNYYLIAAAAVSAVMMLVMLVLSPNMAKTVFVDFEINKRPNTEGKSKNNEDIDFEKYSLSQREQEVARLLLKGMTMRQISGELSISQSTVNTYCTAIYRKCGINSRTELILLFK